MKTNLIKFAAITALFTAVVFPSFSSELQVDYLEGMLEVQEAGGTWHEVDFGDAIPDDAVLRLSYRGYAELSFNEQRVTLVQDGVYQARDLLPSSDFSSAAMGINLRKAMGSKFLAISSEVGDYRGTAVGGVRGAEAGKKQATTWEAEDTDHLSIGKELFAAGSYASAMKIFQDGALWGSGPARRECLFRAAVTQNILGNPREARMLLDQVKPLEDDPFLDEYVVTVGTLFIESREYDRAEKILNAYLYKKPQGASAQAAHLLRAYNYLSQGDLGSYHEEMTKTRDMDPQSEIGQMAAGLL